ncbi:MAG: SGNH/GDSL hydrolase family protein [Elusimicrobiota bacterium]
MFVNTLPLVNGWDRVRRYEELERPSSLSERKEPGEVRVFVFGESSVAGSPWGPEMSSPAMLMDSLAGKVGRSKLTVVNMGVEASTTMDAYYYLISIRKYEPDFIIFYLGSNNRYDADLEMCLPANLPAVHAGWRFLVERSRLLAFLRIMGPVKLVQGAGWEERLRIFGKPRCDPEAGLQAWTDILVETATGMGAAVVATSPALNVLFYFENDNVYPTVDWTHKRFYESLDPDYRTLLRCFLSPACDDDEGLRAALYSKERLEREGSPDTRALGMGRAWARSAARYGADYVDFRRILADISRVGKPASPLIFDEVHLSLEGNWLLAEQWRARIEGRISSSGSSTPPRTSPPDLSESYRRLSYPHERILLEQGVDYLCRKNPLFAYPLLKQAADRFGNKSAALLIQWLRYMAGLRPGLSARERARLDALDPADYWTRAGRYPKHGELARGPKAD